MFTLYRAVGARGAGGNHGTRAMTPHIFAGQLTLSQPWGQIMPTTLQFALSLIFRPSYDPTLARFANCFSPLKSHVEKKYMAYEFCSFALTSPQKVDLRRLVTFLHNHDSFYEPHIVAVTCVISWSDFE